MKARDQFSAYTNMSVSRTTTKQVAKRFTLIVQSAAATSPMPSYHVVTVAPGTNDAAAPMPDAFLDSRRRTAGWWTRMVADGAGASQYKALKADVDGCNNNRMCSLRLASHVSLSSMIISLLWTGLLSIEQIAADVLFGDHPEMAASAPVHGLVANVVMPNFLDAPTPASSVAHSDESAPAVGRGGPVENAGRQELDF